MIEIRVLGLDPLSKQRMWDNLKKIKDEGKTILLTTHDLDEATFLADDIVVIEKGKLNIYWRSITVKI